MKKKYARATWLSLIHRVVSACSNFLLDVAIYLFLFSVSTFIFNYNDYIDPPIFIFIAALYGISYLSCRKIDNICDFIYDFIYRRKNGRRTYEECNFNTPFWNKIKKEIAEIEQLDDETAIAIGATALQEDDMPEAFVYYACSAKKGNMSSLFLVGYLLIDGPGIYHNWRKGLDCMRKAAETGNEDAIAYLGEQLYEGRYLPRDLQEAHKWLTIGNEIGIHTSMYYLGLMYDRGEYVEKDEDKAYQLFLYASASNDETLLRKIRRAGY